MQRFKPLNFLFYISVFSLSLGQFALLSRSGEAPIYAFDAILGLYVFLGLFIHLTSKKKISLTKVHLGFLLFSVLAVISLIPRITTLPLEELFISTFYLIRWVIYLIASVITYNLLKSKQLKLDSFVRVFLFSALLISIAGFVQLVVLPDFTTLDASLGWDPHKNRLASGFFDPNFTGGYLALVLGFVSSLHFYKIRKLRLAEIFVYLPFILVALFLTFSRSSWGMLALIILALGVFKARWFLLVALIVGFSTYYAVPRVQTRLSGTTDPSDSAAFRLVSWKNTFDIAKDNYLLGVGFNTFRFTQQDYGYVDPGTTGGNSAAGSDSSLLLVLATTGILGFLAFMFSFLGVYRSVFLLPLVLGLLLHAQFVNSLFYPQIMFAWLSMWGTSSLYRT